MSRVWTQNELASKVNVSRQAVSTWEIGASLPDAEILIRLARLFDTTVDALLIGAASHSHDVRSVDIDALVGLAPVITRKSVDTILEVVSADQVHWHLISLGPFAGRSAMNRLVRGLPPGRLGDKGIDSLRGFVDEDVLIWSTR